MRKTFKIDFVDRYPMIEHNGKRFIVDTGSNVTYHKEGTLNFLGKDYPTITSMGGVTHEELCNFTNLEFDVLLGVDVMSDYKVIFDYENKEITFLSEDEKDMEGTKQRLINDHGHMSTWIKYPFIYRYKRMILDTGAPISYIAGVAHMLPEDSVVGNLDDFIIGLGKFNTSVYNIDGIFNGCHFNAEHGDMPWPLDFEFMTNDEGIGGILGYDFFKQFKLMIDFKKQTMLWDKVDWYVRNGGIEDKIEKTKWMSCMKKFNRNRGTII